MCVMAAQQAQQAQQWADETLEEDDDEFEDEGFAEPPAPSARLTYRRSTDLSTGGQGYVAKAIRVRKAHRNGNRLR